MIQSLSQLVNDFASQLSRIFDTTVGSTIRQKEDGIQIILTIKPQTTVEKFEEDNE